MNAIICDRCEALMKDVDEPYAELRLGGVWVNERGQCVERTMDLCSVCTREIVETFKGRRFSK